MAEGWQTDDTRMADSNFPDGKPSLFHIYCSMMQLYIGALKFW
jgi:hypothetical protein